MPGRNSKPRRGFRWGDGIQEVVQDVSFEERPAMMTLCSVVYRDSETGDLNSVTGVHVSCMQGEYNQSVCRDEALSDAKSVLEEVVSKKPAAGEGVSFGDALIALKAGKRITRAGWNGKNMWVAMSAGHDPYTLDSDSKTYTRRDYLYMKTGDEALVPWVASQTDLLAEDWEEV